MVAHKNLPIGCCSGRNAVWREGMLLMPTGLIDWCVPLEKLATYSALKLLPSHQMASHAGKSLWKVGICIPICFFVIFQEIFKINYWHHTRFGNNIIVFEIMNKIISQTPDLTESSSWQFARVLRIACPEEWEWLENKIITLKWFVLWCYFQVAC